MDAITNLETDLIASILEFGEELHQRGDLKHIDKTFFKEEYYAYLFDRISKADFNYTVFISGFNDSTERRAIESIKNRAILNSSFAGACRQFRLLVAKEELRSIVTHMDYDIEAATEALDRIKLHSSHSGPAGLAGCSPLQTISAFDLLQTEYKPLNWLIDGFLHEGFGLLVAPPKTGKSWLALDLCLSVASGKPFWGMNTNKSGVLYLALEDSYTRLKSRTSKILHQSEEWGDSTPNSSQLFLQNCRFDITSSDIDSGLVEQIEEHLTQFPDTRLVVIDVLQHVRSKKGSGSKNAYEADSTEMKRFIDISRRFNLCLLCVHHDVKSKHTTDPLARVSGSNGIAGGADLIMTIIKDERTDNNAVLFLTGRDVDMRQFRITFNKDDCRWHCKGEVDTEAESIKQKREDYENDPIVKTVKVLLDDSLNGLPVELTASELIEEVEYIACKDSGLTASHVGRRIAALADEMLQNDGIVYTYLKGDSRIHKFYRQ